MSLFWVTLDDDDDNTAGSPAPVRDLPFSHIRLSIDK
jgi:hypothetical protein